jgi:hypothetical protein
MWYFYAVNAVQVGNICLKARHATIQFFKNGVSGRSSRISCYQNRLVTALGCCRSGFLQLDARHEGEINNVQSKVKCNEELRDTILKYVPVVAPLR